MLKWIFTFSSKARRRKIAALLALASSTADESISALQRFAMSKSTLATTAQHALRLMAAEQKEAEENGRESTTETTETPEVEHASR